MLDDVQLLAWFNRPFGEPRLISGYQDSAAGSKDEKVVRGRH